MTNAAEQSSVQLPTKLAGLDHLRALAISLVLLYHYRIFPHPEWLTSVGKFGWTGVDLFFVLSGYLISSQLFLEITRHHGLSLNAYFIKRTFRILPAYLVVLAIYFLVPAFREREALPPLWKFLTFTRNFGADLQHQGTFSHAWSLCVEEQFYLLLPLGLLAVFSMKKTRWAAGILPALVVFGFAARLLSWTWKVVPQLNTDHSGLDWYKWIYYPTYNRLDGLLVGIGIAALFHFRPNARARLAQHGNLLIMTSLVMLASAYFLCLEEQSFAASIYGFPLIALGYGTLVVGAISPTSVLFRLRPRVSAKIAALSYPIYLTHKGIIHLTQQHFSAWGLSIDGNGMFLLCLMLVLVGALLLNVLIEKPFLRIRETLLKQSQPAARQRTPKAA